MRPYLRLFDDTGDEINAECDVKYSDPSQENPLRITDQCREDNFKMYLEGESQWDIEKWRPVTTAGLGNSTVPLMFNFRIEKEDALELPPITLVFETFSIACFYCG